MSDRSETWSEPWGLTIAAAGRALRDGSLTSAALTESVLARTDATEPTLNAFITRTDDLARAQAAAADAEDTAASKANSKPTVPETMAIRMKRSRGGCSAPATIKPIMMPAV